MPTETKSKLQSPQHNSPSRHLYYIVKPQELFNIFVAKISNQYSSSPSSSIPYQRGSLGHHRWFCNQFSPFFPVLHCPLGLAELQACLFPNVVYPPLPLSALSSSPFHCALQDGFGQTWWTENMTIPLQFASLHGGQVFVWSICQLDLGPDFLVGNRCL